MKTFRVFILVSILCSVIVSCNKSNKDIIDGGDIRIWKYQDCVITNFEYWYFDAEGYWNVFILSLMARLGKITLIVTFL